MKKLGKYSFWIAGGLGLVGALMMLRPPANLRGMDVDGFQRLPVLEGGRLKPLDSLARNSLLVIRGQQSFRHQDRTVQASEWILDVLFRPQVADQQPIFVINDPDVLGLMGIRQTSERYFTFRQILPYINEIQREANAAHAIDAKQRTRFQGAVANLFERVYLYHRLKNTIQLEGGPPLATEIAEVATPAAAQRQAQLADIAYFRPVPPLPGQKAEAWANTGEALRALAMGQVNPSLEPWSRIGWAYGVQDAQAFNKAVKDLQVATFAPWPDAQAHVDHETTFNRAQPFYVGMVLYVLAALAVFVSWIWKPDVLRRAGFGLLCAGAIVQTAGLVSRIVLQGRPPVTNLYSSAVFVGWGAVLLGIVLERTYRNGFGTAVAAVSGFASLLVAHHLSTDGDTMEMMRAVLDSNFWLATHVTTITIGYSGTFLAGAIAIAWALQKQFAPRVNPETSKALSGMVYGIVAFSLLFSFVGTVLGGIWADQSWGRFWGWDPKENGALLIVLWCAIILHARWGGFARERGIMTMAIFGNVITSFSWFGVNMLGVGLHSYGFMDKAFWALAGFMASQVVFMILAFAPRQFWKGKAARDGANEAQPAKA
ncbi:MAG TPA: cytochrome c biogenesis protein CcsA [Anaeromyxobacteraceae bacterium]|nr:cytochrome c biogenesis protein CcsA [Anaeromyxobacteraceae bacterium]